MIVGPRYNDVDPAVEAAYQRAAEAETASRLDAIAARLEARRALPCEVCDDGEECACCAVDREFAEVVAVVREVAAVADSLENPTAPVNRADRLAFNIAARKIRRILAPLTKEETNGR